MPEKRDDVVPVFVRRVKRRPEVFAVVLSISSLEFGVVVQIPTLPFPRTVKRELADHDWGPVDTSKALFADQVPKVFTKSPFPVDGCE